MKSSGIIYYHDWNYRASQQPLQGHALKRAPKQSKRSTVVGLGMLVLALGGLIGPMIPAIRLETQYALRSVHLRGESSQAAPVSRTVFNPLKQPDGSSIQPINTEFSLVVPKIGINAAVLPAVNPTKPGEYLEALKKGIAHSSLSYFPDEDGTVYLFSHSTNYDWFVKDMNAVFYLLKNLEENDMVVLFYKNTSYTYKITGKQIVKPTAVNYLAPQSGAKRLILQTCWPPGSTTERLLIFADLVQESNQKI